MLNRKVKTLMFRDSKYLFDTITKLTTIAGKRLLIDVTDIRENYTTGHLSNVAHVLSKFNLANVFTKERADETFLTMLMSNGKLSHLVSQWILTD